MALEEVTFKRRSTIVSFRSDLFGESKSSNMQSCVVYGALFVLMVTVLAALVIALAVVATKSKPDDAGNGHEYHVLLSQS